IAYTGQNRYAQKMRFRSNRLAGAFLLSCLGVWTFLAEGQDATDLHRIQERLRVPAQIARVTDAYLPVPSREDSGRSPRPSALPDFILIQDVHRHPQVQSRIANLIIQGYD